MFLSVVTGFVLSWMINELDVVLSCPVLCHVWGFKLTVDESEKKKEAKQIFIKDETNDE